jgi:hypothetical protein
VVCAWREANAGVDHADTVGSCDHGVQVDLGDLGKVVARPREPVQNVLKCFGVGRRLAAVAVEETRGPRVRDEGAARASRSVSGVRRTP